MNSTLKDHIAMVIKYTGISFITGGISHGFFSGERQIITSLIGVGFFAVGTLLEKKSEEKDYLKTIIFSSILAIAIGALTGGLQHFPDSPDRSLWIVPLGFILSIYAYISLENKSFLKKDNIIYSAIGFMLFIIISVSFYMVVQAGYIGGSGHDHGSSHSEITEDTINIIEGEKSMGDGHDDHEH